MNRPSLVESDRVLTATFPVGTRYRCTLWLPLRPARGLGYMTAEWEPRTPHRLTDDALRDAIATGTHDGVLVAVTNDPLGTISPDVQYAKSLRTQRMHVERADELAAIDDDAEGANEIETGLVSLSRLIDRP